jgi:uncharacterized protein YjdB
MLDRFWPRALFLAALVAPIAGCTNQVVDTITVSPTSQTIAAGQTFQFTATGTIAHGSNHPSSSSNITDQVTWTSSLPSVATISSTGVATAVAAGTTTITATINGFTGVLTATATLTVSSTGGTTGTVSGITSLTVIPGSQTVAVPGDTSQFIAIGTSTSGSTTDLTNQVSWTSSSVQIATVGGNTGLATAIGAGSVTITAVYVNPNSQVSVTGSATFTVTSGVSQQYTAVQIIPSTQSVSASGQTGQFIAIATLGSNGLEEDVTNSPNITWQSSETSVATVTSGLKSGNGMVQGVGVGATTVSVELQNPGGGIVTATATVSVTLTAPPEPILSLTIIPGSITVNNFNLTGQFLAVATYSSAPYVRDVTNSPTTTWISTEPEIFPVNTNTGGNTGASAGIVTSYGSGNAVIVAEAQATDGTIQTATATFNCPLVLPNTETGAIAASAGSCYPGEPPAQTLLSTLTIYNEGLNTTNWEVTAPSATGTPDVLHCGPGWTLGGGSVCTATYPVDTLTPAGTPGVVLEAQGGAFGGWSYNCTPSDSQGNYLTAPPYWTAAGPNYCVAPVETIYQGQPVELNTTVGAIFN